MLFRNTDCMEMRYTTRISYLWFGVDQYILLIPTLQKSYLMMYILENVVTKSHFFTHFKIM